MRLRAAMFLRQAYDSARQRQEEENDNEKYRNAKSDDDDVENVVIRTLELALKDTRHGSLLRHEIAYVIGQIQDTRGCTVLEEILSNASDCDIVRHECGEALGAIGTLRSIPVLEHALQMDPKKPPEIIGHTCQIALANIQWKMEMTKRGNDTIVDLCARSPYASIDPAPPHPDPKIYTYELSAILRNASLPLFERYRAMFSLRNDGGSYAVRELGRTLVEDKSSVLLRHEVAYVLGQIQDPESFDSLVESLRCTNEHAMVRHESAEALGALVQRWDESKKVLTEFLTDKDSVVRESCAVALDTAEYWGH